MQIRNIFYEKNKCMGYNQENWKISADFFLQLNTSLEQSCNFPESQSLLVFCSTNRNCSHSGTAHTHTQSEH